jgi:hypothetical protein
MEKSKLILSNPVTDQLIFVDLHDMPGWPGSAPLHTLALPDGKTIYISYMAAGEAGEPHPQPPPPNPGNESVASRQKRSPRGFTLPTAAMEHTLTPAPAGLAVVYIDSLNWKTGKASVRVLKDLRVDSPGTPSNFLPVTQVDPSQPIPDWTRPPFSQVHGPTLMPGSNYAFFTMWTDNRVIVVNVKTHTLVSAFVHYGITEQTHGLVFNDQGTYAIASRYFYDGGLYLFRANRKKGTVEPVKSIQLGDKQRYGAFVHTTTWLNEFLALSGAMQLGPTSLTPKGSTIAGPSVWLTDIRTGKAKQIIGPTKDVNGAGCFRPASYVTVAKDKLFVAEEDSLDGSFGNDGYIAIYDIKDVNKPVFLKRLKPGVDLPADYSIAHSFSVTLDEKSVLVESYSSRYMLRIDTKTLKVVKVVGKQDGLVMPHGGYIAGRMH